MHHHQGVTELAPVLTNCSACRSPFVEAINKKMKEGVADVKISEWLKENGGYISRVSLGKHKRDHLVERHEAARIAAKKVLEKQAKTIKAKGDLASLVANQVYNMVEDGALMPTLAEGLRAQEMIDRRQEKGADRDLTIMLAQVLGGAMIVEGTAEEVEQEQIDA
jgi:hypothetical protein